MDGLNGQSSPNLELVKTALDKLIDGSRLQYARTGKAEATDPVVFTQDSASNAAVVSTVLGGGGYFKKNTSDQSEKKSSNKAAPTPKTTLIAEFSKNLNIPRTFMADQQQGAVAKSVRQENAAWMASRDRNAISVYALGFTTQQTIDGVVLFSSSHINSNGDTVDNAESGAMTDTTVNTSVVSLRNQLNQGGVKMGYEPDFLLTSNAQHKLAMETCKSVLRAGTGNNDLNYYSEMFPGMKVLYSSFVDDTSTTAYYIGAAGHGVMRFEREAFFTNLVPWETDANDNYVYKMRAREEVDSISYEGLVGSTGA